MGEPSQSLTGRFTWPGTEKWEGAPLGKTLSGRLSSKGRKNGLKKIGY